MQTWRGFPLIAKEAQYESLHTKPAAALQTVVQEGPTSYQSTYSSSTLEIELGGQLESRSIAADVEDSPGAKNVQYIGVFLDYDLVNGGEHRLPESR